MDEFGSKLNEILSNPDMMSKISGFAESLFGGEDGGEGQETRGAQGEKTGPSGRGMEDLGFDPALFSRIASLMKRQGDKREERALLEAMRPYLSEKRREKMDRAIRLARLASIAEIALNELGKDGRDEQI